MEKNNIIPLVPMQVPLSEEEKQEVELFAGIGYAIQKIAILLEEDYQKLMIDYKNPHSHFHQAYVVVYKHQLFIFYRSVCESPFGRFD